MQPITATRSAQAVSPAAILGAGISPADVKLAVLGNEDASRHIVESLHRPVFSTIYRFLGRGFCGDVEDIAQEIFLKVFRYLHRFDPHRGVKLTTWVFSIVKYHCFDLVKRQKIKTVSLDGSSAAPEDRQQRRPSASVLNSELGQKIKDAVQSLRPSYRRVFVLREYERLSYGAIAEVTGLPEGTVKSKLHRAKTALRQELAPYTQDRVGAGA